LAKRFATRFKFTDTLLFVADTLEIEDTSVFPTVLLGVGAVSYVTGALVNGEWVDGKDRRCHMQGTK